MSATVRCTGHLHDDPRHPTHYRLTSCAFYRPWKGERFPSGYTPHLHNGDCAICEEVERVMTAKPCPRCGGRVELIQPQPSP